jgi:hypothetical protein
MTQSFNISKNLMQSIESVERVNRLQLSYAQQRLSLLVTPRTEKNGFRRYQR